MSELNFFVITDLHFYNLERLGRTDAQDQVALNESGAIIDAAFEQIAAQTDTKIVLIAGDLCVNGACEHHEGIIAKLRQLQNKGKRIYIITSLHDYGPSPIHTEGEEGLPNVVYRDELYDLYKDFGFCEAIASFEKLSYVVQLAPKLRLLCLNDDGDSRNYFGFVEGQLDWILAQIAKAKTEGHEIFAMTHHAIIPPSSIYPIIAPQEMLCDYENVSKILADAGLHFIFTGHTHMQDIRSIRTDKGNILYQISTGALTGYDTPLRKISIKDGKMHIKTQSPKEVDCDLGGKSLSEFTRDLFDNLLHDIFYGAAHDIDLLARNAGNFSMDSTIIYKYKLPIKIIGKFFYSLTVGRACLLFLCPRKAAKSIRKIKVTDLIMEIVRNIYSGNEIYSPDTDMGKAILAVMGRLGFFVNPLLKKLGIPPLHDFILSLIYDPTPDNDAVLPLPDETIELLKN